MNTSLTSSPVAAYWQYLEQNGFSSTAAIQSRLVAHLDLTRWEEPETALELNNFAVTALIEAEQCDAAEVRTVYFEMALEALTKGVEAEPGHLLCVAHLAIAQSMIGETRMATQLAYSSLLNNLNFIYNTTESTPLGLVYIPPDRSNRAIARQELLQAILQAENGNLQAVLLLADVLCRSQLVFYNAGGLRFLQLAVPLLPSSAALKLKLGLAQLMSRQDEGLVYLQQARQLAPHYAPTLQALYLAYREQQPNVAAYWLHTAREQANSISKSNASLEWAWTNLESDSPFTYLPFDENLLVAVEPSFRSIVTSVLLAEGDWFEAEIEFWRHQLQPGMTVIDVGANVGVYTFSAAQQVTETGRVLAVEPFSGCVRCLQETCQVNHLSQVTVCAGAASDRPGTARLALHTASELNEVVIGEAETTPTGNYEEVACFTLDSLLEQEDLSRVDWLKIDAEGHEMQVLVGCDRILTDFAPGILYENIAGSSGNNTPVAEYLQSKGYQLFRYQPYLQQLIPINTIEELQGNLNIIALPQSH